MNKNKQANHRIILIFLLIFTFLIVGCKKEPGDDIEEDVAPVADYVGHYISYDGDPLSSYIELHEDFTFIRNSNLCEGIITVEGTYSVSDTDGKVVITLTTTKNNSYGFIWDNMVFSFKYENDKLHLLGSKKQYAYYDCSNTTIFIKD